MISDRVAYGQWIVQIDAIVSDVFQLMLLQSCAIGDEASPTAAEISAKVTFSGTIEGACVVEFPAAAAAKLTGAFLGSQDGGWDPAMIEDAVGELCNMIAGGWKSLLGETASTCRLSAPEILRYPERLTLNSAETAADASSLRRTYAFDQSAFKVILALT